MGMEEWEFVEGYHKKYSVSSLGNVRNNLIWDKVAKVLAGVVGNQYHYVNLSNKCGTRKLVRVNRLVAKAFLPNPENKPMVDHINRDKLDNRADNLRWATSSENQRNTDNAVMLEIKQESGEGEVHLMDWLESKYPLEEVGAMYGLSYQLIVRDNITSVEDLTDAISLHYCEDRTQHTKVVEWEGGQSLLWDVCKELGKELEYEKIRARLAENGCVYSAIYNLPTLRGDFILMEGESGVGLVFFSVTQLSSTSSRSVAVCNIAIEETLSYSELLCYRYPSPKIEIDGEWKTRKEWIAFYETSEQRVVTNSTKYKVSFEDAVRMPTKRVRRVLVNGKEMTVKEMWESYGFDAKYCGSRKAKQKTTFKETLRGLGVDVQGMEITPL